MRRSAFSPAFSASARPGHKPRPQVLALVAAITSAITAAFSATPVLAQSTPDTGQLETITVTATKRPQPLQTTPIAISVLSGGALEEANLNNMATITSQTPTVNFRANASNKDSALFIRGVGTISTSPGVEPTVSTVLDGVVTSRPGQATLDLVEIDRIEILRGPQGTLFGKNASAGVINIISKAPGAATEGYLDLGLYQGNERRVRGGVSGEVVKGVVRASVAAMAGKFDGNVTNVFNGAKVNGYDRKGLRGRIDITASPEMKMSFIADYVKADDTTPTGVPYSTNVTTYPTGVVTANPLYGAAVSPVVPAPNNRQNNSDLNTRVSDVNSGFSWQMDYTGINNVQLTSITAYRKWKNTQFQDQDRLGAIYRQFVQSHDRGDLDFHQLSQELRVASTAKNRFFDYVAGLFYIEGTDDERYQRDVQRCANTTATALPSGLVPCSAGSITLDNGVANYGVRNKSESVFGEGTFNFTPGLRALAGLRYTSDTLSYYHGRVATATGVPGVGATRATVTGATTNTATSGRIGPQFEVSKDIMAYATYSRGYKGPAYNVFFNMTAAQDNVLAPEKSKSVEAGLKTQFLDQRVRLNIAAFSTEYDGYQANVPDLVNGTIVTRLINAGKVDTKGFEFDLTARLTQQLTLNASAANIKARVKQFNCPTGAAASCDINGKPLPFSPDWKVALRAKFTQPLGDSLNLDVGVDTNWQSKTNFDLSQQPDSFQPSYAIVNATVGLTSNKGGWRTALLLKNLGNKSYATFVQSSGTNINRYVPRDDQRYIGVTGRYDF
jgi:iron complex outermembrane recepter protein